ncbi:MAG: hypothetical protein C0598_12395 [Marinilabiliales bacterium]|nr:MAG: hypothetical protein C0598_12395 [Marinilabiliales bacterium]
MESQIKKLQDKYWAGKTSVEEEKELKELLKSQENESPEKIFFKEMEELKQDEVKIDFDYPKTKKTIIWKISSIAATIAILIAFAIGYSNYEDNDPFEITNPEQAYEVSLQALRLVSSELNKGKVYSSRIEKINEVKQSINK